MKRIKTWGEIYSEFLKKTEIEENKIEDYRPCAVPYFDIAIPKSIVVWLNGGNRLIYVPDTIEVNDPDIDLEN